MNGWVLLHKKIWDNRLLSGNPYALAVWIWLLTHCNDDGLVTCGRTQIARETGVKSETVRYWLTRFLQENYQLTTIKTTNKFSTFYICKWKEYQRKTTSTSTRKLQENYQPPTTNKEERRKKKKIEIAQFQKKYPNLNVQDEYEKAVNWVKMNGKRYKDYNAFFDNWCKKATEFAKEKNGGEDIKLTIPSYAKPFVNDDGTRRDNV